MSIANTEPRHLPPTHPGEFLREDFMPDYGLTASSLAAALGVSRQTIHELLREERAITPLMALRLSCLFGNSPVAHAGCDSAATRLAHPAPVASGRGLAAGVRIAARGRCSGPEDVILSKLRTRIANVRSSC
jgi:addiction module HigA family antidote